VKIKAELEHPAQAVASAFLKALADGEAAGVFERLSRDTRGRLEGLHAARHGAALHEAPVALGDIVAPLRASALAVLGDAERIGRFGVSGVRRVDRDTAYVLLIPDIERTGLLTEDQWRPEHLLAFVQESREWLVDLARTASLSAEAGLPDPLGVIT
jgi:hypothetical protein